MFETAASGEHVNAIEQTISQFLPIANIFLGVIKYDDDAITLVNEQIGEAAQLMRNASGLYDTAARAAASL